MLLAPRPRRLSRVIPTSRHSVSTPSRWTVAAALVVLLAVASGTPAAAEDASRLRVGISGDYAPFSSGGTSAPAGFDVEVARAYAENRGVTLEFVSFRWPRLLAGLHGKRFDVAMSGVTVRPERSVAGRFTTPVAETGAVVLVRQPERWDNIEDLNRPDVRIAVNAGGHLERVANATFPRASLIAIPDNAAVRRALLEESGY